MPPTKDPDRTRRFLLKPGTPCQVSKVSPRRVELPFEQHEGEREGFYTFRHQGHLIRVSAEDVVHHRKEGPRDRE